MVIVKQFNLISKKLPGFKIEVIIYKTENSLNPKIKIKNNCEDGVEIPLEILELFSVIISKIYVRFGIIYPDIVHQEFDDIPF